MQNKKVIFNANTSSIDSKVETKFNISAIKNITIASFIDKKMVLKFENFEKRAKANNFIFQREATWIRIMFKNNIFRDFVATQVIGIGSKEGVVFEVAGIFKEISIKFAVNEILKFALENNYKAATADLFFKYQSNIGTITKNDFKFLTTKKVDLTMDPIVYTNKRQEVFQEMLMLSAIKNVIKTSRKMLSIKINEELKYA